MAYEFSNADGEVIKRVGLRLTTQGIILIIAGIAGLIYSIINFSTADQTTILVFLIQSIVEIIIGGSLLFAPSYFTRVAETEGEDISELMGGIDQLNRAFKIVWIALTVNLVLDVILITLAGGA